MCLRPISGHLGVFLTFVEELSFHIMMGWMEHMILNGSVISYS